MPREFTLTNGWSKSPSRGRSAWGLLALFLVSCTYLNCVSAQQPAPASGQAIHVAVDRVNVGVVVTDPNGKFVEGLQRDNFQVSDNGTPQPITEFSSINTPAQVLLVVEAGPAVYLLQDSHLFVADTLLNGLSPGDNVAIACYNESPTPILNFTTDKRAAQAALDQIQFNLGYGALNLAASLNTVLDWLMPIPGKKNIVLISTGVDTSTAAAAQSTLARLQAADVQILAISMSGPIRTSKDANKAKFQQTMQTFAQADTWLTTLASATGGRAWFPENAKAFQETYNQIAEIVRHEYSLAFAPPLADGALHSITVKVTAAPNGRIKIPSNPRVDHRKGYIAPKPPGQP
jgi:VWFA-related protein